MDDYMTAKEVAVKVRLSVQTIRRYTMLKQIPIHKIVRAVRYKQSEIEKWIEERKAGLKENQSYDQADLFFENKANQSTEAGEAGSLG